MRIVRIWRLLNYGKEAKESQLTSVMWYKDTAGKMDERVVAAAGENKGLVKRASFTKSSKVVDMMGRIHSECVPSCPQLCVGV